MIHCIISHKKKWRNTNGSYSYQQSDALGRYVSDDRIRMVASADHCQLENLYQGRGGRMEKYYSNICDYISYKIAWQLAYFWLTMVLGIVSSCLQGTLETNDSLMISMIIVLIKIILAIISIMYSVKLARAFGRGTGFAIGLIFLQPIFMLILGFGDDRYYGADK